MLPTNKNVSVGMIEGFVSAYYKYILEQEVYSSDCLDDAHYSETIDNVGEVQVPGQYYDYYQSSQGKYV